MIDKAPFKITTLLTDNGKEFTDRFCAAGERQPTGSHAVDQVCADNHIEHPLTKPRTPQTNGMIERFNGRIADVLRTHRDSAASLQATLKRFVYLYNHYITQKNLRHKTPLQTLQHWYAQQPQLFIKIPRNHTGHDTLTLAAAGLGGAMPTFALDSLRGAAIEKMSASPAKRKIDVVEGGIERTFEQQPPLIPHKIESYKLNLRQHGCLKCHSKARAEQENTKPPSASHFVDRDGNQLGKLSSRRYFCTQCHAVQIKGKPLVENSFQGLK